MKSENTAEFIGGKLVSHRHSPMPQVPQFGGDDVEK
jgi:hypothetical protein